MNAGVVLWARGELRRRWGTLALLAVLIGISGGASIAAAAGAHRTETAFDRMLTATRQPNLSVTSAIDNGFVDLDANRLDDVMQIEGVSGVAEFAYVAVAPDGFPNFFALAFVDRRGAATRPLLLEGKPIDDVTSLRADDVLLNESMRNQLGKGAGDTVVLRSLTPDQFIESLSGESEMVPGGPTMNARIVGVSRSPEDVSDAPDPFLLLPPAFYEKYHDTVASCVCTVWVNADPETIETVTAELKNIYPNAVVEPAEDLAGRIADTVALQRRAWWLIALTAAVAGVIALFQASARAGRILLTGDDARRALGMTQSERRLGRLLIIAPALVVGAAAALGVAYALSSLAPVGLTRVAEPSPGLRWDGAVIAPGALVVLVVSMAVAGTATITARQDGERRATSGKVGGPQVAFGNRLAFGPGRGAIIGVLLSTAGLVGALTLEHSLDHVLATPALYGANFDVGSFLDSGDDKRAVADKLAPDSGVEAVGLVWATLDTRLHLVGPAGETDVDPNAYETIKGTLSITQTAGREPSRNDELALGRVAMNQLGATIGDRITATGAKGTIELTVVGDNLDPGVDIAGHGAAMTMEGLSAVGDATIQGAVARFAPGADHAALIDRYASLGFTPVTPPSEVGHIGQLGGLPGRVGQLLTLLGVAAVLNAIVLTVRSARREIALHRALGFTSAQVIGVHLWQFIVTACTGIVIGGGVGFIVGRAIDRHLVSSVGAIADTIVPTEVWMAAIGTVVVCLAAGAITAALALRHRPGFELRTE